MKFNSTFFRFLNLYEKIKDVEISETEILTYPWEVTFIRFLNTPSASEDDTLLLTTALKCLTVLCKFYKFTGKQLH